MWAHRHSLPRNEIQSTEDNRAKKKTDLDSTTWVSSSNYMWWLYTPFKLCELMYVLLFLNYLRLVCITCSWKSPDYYTSSSLIKWRTVKFFPWYLLHQDISQHYIISSWPRRWMPPPSSRLTPYLFVSPPVSSASVFLLFFTLSLKCTNFQSFSNMFQHYLSFFHPNYSKS